MTNHSTDHGVGQIISWTALTTVPEKFIITPYANINEAVLVKKAA